MLISMFISFKWKWWLDTKYRWYCLIWNSVKIIWDLDWILWVSMFVWSGIWSDKTHWENILMFCCLCIVMIKGQFVFHCCWKNNQQECIDMQCFAICMFDNMLGTLRTMNLLTGICDISDKRNIMLILCVVGVLESNPWCRIWTDCIVFQSSKHIFQGE